MIGNQFLHKLAIILWRDFVPYTSAIYFLAVNTTHDDFLFVCPFGIIGISFDEPINLGLQVGVSFFGAYYFGKSLDVFLVIFDKRSLQETDFKAFFILVFFLVINFVLFAKNNYIEFLLLVLKQLNRNSIIKYWPLHHFRKVFWPFSCHIVRGLSFLS